MIKLSRHDITVGALVAVCVVVVSVSTALAGDFGNRLQSSIGAGMSFAGSGTDAYGLSGIYWNPAAINTATGFD
jgi:long-chain fatty acid transport protein